WPDSVWGSSCPWDWIYAWSCRARSKMHSRSKRRHDRSHEYRTRARDRGADAVSFASLEVRGVVRQRLHALGETPMKPSGWLAMATLRSDYSRFAAAGPCMVVGAESDSSNQPNALGNRERRASRGSGGEERIPLMRSIVSGLLALSFVFVVSDRALAKKCGDNPGDAAAVAAARAQAARTPPLGGAAH